MQSLLDPGLVDLETSDDESNLAPLAEAGIEEGHEEEGLIEKNIYGFVIKSLVRDVLSVYVGDKVTVCLRFSRLMLSLGTLFFNILIQLALLYWTKDILTFRTVRDMREAYTKFESLMVPPEAVTAGWKRQRFDSFDEEFQTRVCEISFARPIFLALTLFIWSLVCVAEIKRVYENFKLLIIQLPQATKASAQLSILGQEQEDTERTSQYFLEMGFSTLQASGLAEMFTKLQVRSRARRREADKVIVISSLTVCTKVTISAVVLTPRLFLTLVVMWLGSRWLVATIGFTDMLLHLVALQFIINLKDLLFHVCVSAHGKADLASTRVYQPHRHPKFPVCWVFMGAFLWGLVALAWALLYMFEVQEVLPGYRWDLHSLCRERRELRQEA